MNTIKVVSKQSDVVAIVQALVRRRLKCNKSTQDNVWLNVVCMSRALPRNQVWRNVLLQFIDACK